MAKWKVNDGTQVFINGVLYEGGSSFEATEDEVAAANATNYVKKGREASSKAQEPSANKAQQSSANKSTK